MRSFFHLLAALLTGALLSSCQKESKSFPLEVRLESQRPLMGTLFRCVTYATDLPKARAEMEAAFDLAAEVERCASDYAKDSELNRLCRHPSGEPVLLTPLFFDLLQEAQEMAKFTKGAYDPTLGPVTHLWRQTRRKGELPEAAELARALTRCGYQFLTLDPEKQTATLEKEGMQLDLGGIAKGYAADLIYRHLADAGFPRTMVAAGGDLRLGHPPVGKEGWTTALRTNSQAPGPPLLLSHCAVSTSGDLYQSIKIGEISYSHLIDPATGLGLTRKVSASVVAPLARFSDPLATAACLMPPSEAESFFKKLPDHQLYLHMEASE